MSRPGQCQAGCRSIFLGSRQVAAGRPFFHHSQARGRRGSPAVPSCALYTCAGPLPESNALGPAGRALGTRFCLPPLHRPQVPPTVWQLRHAACHSTVPPAHWCDKPPASPATDAVRLSTAGCLPSGALAPSGWAHQVSDHLTHAEAPGSQWSLTTALAVDGSHAVLSDHSHPPRRPCTDTKCSEPAWRMAKDARSAWWNRQAGSSISDHPTRVTFSRLGPSSTVKQGHNRPAGCRQQA